jgi:malate dehydrogenase (oxaloacetate-decarboxylating)(NADP+)
MLSFSNFGSVSHPLVDIVRKATQIVRQKAPDLEIEGEMQLETAVVPEVAREHFPFSKIQGDANVLVFPDLHSGNIGYKLMQRLGGAETIGPILTGLSKPVHVLAQASDDNEIINMTTIAVVEAQLREKEKSQQQLKLKEELA